MHPGYLSHDLSLTYAEKVKQKGLMSPALLTRSASVFPKRSALGNLQLCSSVQLIFFLRNLPQSFSRKKSERRQGDSAPCWVWHLHALEGKVKLAPVCVFPVLPSLQQLMAVVLNKHTTEMAMHMWNMHVHVCISLGWYLIPRIRNT